jgi:hypothetical protein
MDTLTEARNAFYEKKPTELLPLVVADVVTVKSGSRSGTSADVIALESLPPDPKYLIEFSDGSSAVVALSDLRFVKHFSS